MIFVGYKVLSIIRKLLESALKSKGKGTMGENYFSAYELASALNKLSKNDDNKVHELPDDYCIQQNHFHYLEKDNRKKICAIANENVGQ